MLRLYLVRHAVAEDLPEGLRFGDPLRALTARGRRRFRRGAQAFAQLEEGVDLILSSPVLRAVQTAELLAAALGHDDVRILDELGPDSGAPRLLGRLSSLGVTSAALVGHKRLLSELAVALAGVPIEDAARLRLKRGAIARIDVRKLTGETCGKPRWWLGPSAGPLRDGLPLDGAV
jgi:phosphohistidine phosphatase